MCMRMHKKSLHSVHAILSSYHIVITTELSRYSYYYLALTTCSFPDPLGASDKEEQEVPKITVETAPEAPEDSDQAKKRKESRVSSAKGTKKQNEIPELGVAIKGFVQRKTGWSKWEKSWCVVTYNAIYYTGQEGNKDYSHFTPIMPDSRNSVQDKKGPGNHPGLIIKIAGKKEHISFESGSEVAEWRSRLEEVLGISGVGELLSEDEGDDEGEELDEGQWAEFLCAIPWSEVRVCVLV